MRDVTYAEIRRHVGPGVPVPQVGALLELTALARGESLAALLDRLITGDREILADAAEVAYRVVAAAVLERMRLGYSRDEALSDLGIPGMDFTDYSFLGDDDGPTA